MIRTTIEWKLREKDLELIDLEIKDKELEIEEINNDVFFEQDELYKYLTLDELNDLNEQAKMIQESIELIWNNIDELKQKFTQIKKKERKVSLVKIKFNN